MALLAPIRSLFFAREARPSERPAPASRPARREPPPEWGRLKEFISACDSLAIDLAGLRPGDYVGFCDRRARVDGAVSAGVSIERAARDHGFHDAQHYATVVAYLEARASELYVDDELHVRVRFVAELRAAQAMVDARLREAAQRLLEPIHGVTLDRFAEVSAAIVRLGARPSRAALSSVLSELGVGAATYGAVRRGWLARIERDSTRMLQRRYQDAFLAARSRSVTLAPSGDDTAPSAAARRSWADSLAFA
jgi:hypothetical protein